MNAEKCFEACNDSKCVRARKCMGLADGSPAPRERSFAERFRNLEATVAEGKKLGLTGNSFSPDLIACIREQQAALEFYGKGHTTEAEGYGSAARAVLAKWRIE